MFRYLLNLEDEFVTRVSYVVLILLVMHVCWGLKNMASFKICFFEYYKNVKGPNLTQPRVAENWEAR